MVVVGPSENGLKAGVSGVASPGDGKRRRLHRLAARQRRHLARASTGEPGDQGKRSEYAMLAATGPQLFRSGSIALSKSSIDPPASRLPLMKKVGVELTPNSSAARRRTVRTLSISA